MRKNIIHTSAEQCNLAQMTLEDPVPFLSPTLSIVSSLALPNRFRDGLGDSDPLRLVLLLLALF